MRRSRWWTVAAGWIGVLGVCAAGPVGLADEQAAGGDAAASAEASSDEADGVAAPVEGLLERRTSPVVEPVRQPGREQIHERVGAPAPRVDVDPAVLGVAPGEPMPRLRREGEFIVNRRGRVIRPEGSSEWIFQPDVAEEADDEQVGVKLPPMVIQPSGRLEMIETYMQDGAAAGRFEVSGRVHTYRGTNYLLLTRARPLLESEPQPDPADEADAESADEADAAASAEAADDAGAAVDSDEDPMLAALLRERQAAPSPSPASSRGGAGASGGSAEGARGGASAGAAPGGDDDVVVHEEGSLIVQRRGRVSRSRDGAHVLFVFDADARESPEAPLILLPCQLMETMEQVIQERGDQTVFVVSGQTYSYRGAGYLLPTLMRIAPDRGNLRP